jgi:L-xylulokinase
LSAQVLGIDIGGSVVKAAVFDLQGNLLAKSAFRSVVVGDSPSHAERDPKVMWDSASKAVREVLTMPGVDAGRIAALGVTGFGNGLFLVDAEGKPTRTGIASIDTRAADIVREWRDAGYEDQAWEQTLQPFWSGQPLPIIEWVKRNDPHALKNSRRILSAKDMLRTYLTGKLANERTDLGSGGLFNPTSSQPAFELFEKVGLPEVGDLLSEENILKPYEIAGSLSVEASEVTGLPAGLPVVTGVTDNLAVLIGSGIQDSSITSVVGGTWGINQTLNREHVRDRSVFQSIPTHLDDYQLLVESTPNSMSNFDWYVQQAFNAPAGLDGDQLYQYCEELYLASESKLSDSLVFMPHLYGSPRHPFRTGGFLGLTGDAKPSQMLGAVYEGIAFEHKTLLGRLPASTQKSPVRVSGGILRSKVWLQLFADTFDRTIETPDTDEVGARGIAMVAAVGAGLFDSFAQAAFAMTRVSSEIQPRQERVDQLVRKFSKYSALRDFTLEFALRGQS